MGGDLIIRVPVLLPLLACSFASSELKLGQDMVTLPSPPPPLPSPKSPPRYPDFCGKHRLQVEVQILNREIGFLEEELQSLDDLQPASKCCKEVNEYVGGRPDPMIPINRGKSEPCCVSWSWFRKKVCAGLSSTCCCGSSSPSKSKSEKPKCPCSCSCFTCSPPKTFSCFRRPSCSIPKIACCCPFLLSCRPCSCSWLCRRRRPCRCPAYSCSSSCPDCFGCSKKCCLGCCFCP